MVYERKIRYLDYMSNGERVQGGGFVKLEVKSTGLRMELSVMGLYRVDSLEREVLLCGDGRETSIGRMTISNGRGQFRYECHNLEDIGGAGIRYEELRGIRIPLGAGREISCRWKKEKEDGKGRDSALETPGMKLQKTQDREREEAGAADAGLKASREGESGNAAGAGAKEAPERESRTAAGAGAKDAPERESGTAAGAGAKEAPERESGTAVGADEKDALDEEAKKAEVAGAGGKEMPDKEPGKAEIVDVDTKEPRDKKSDEFVVTSLKETPDRGTGKAARASAKESPGEGFGVVTDRDMGKGAEKERMTVPDKVIKETSDRKAAGESKGNSKQNSGGKQRKSDGAPIRLLDDKWQQLCAIYPHIHPFHDQREYLSIGPADFVLFPSSSYKMANNSFLLHGYYNYNHLLLARLEKKGEISYYIGVPGNYFEREKQVAIMFGFESFECAEEPAQPGDFGYYMMRVQL